VWNPDLIYLGGGNAKHLKLTLPEHVRITANVAGLFGGIALWDERGASGEGRPKRTRLRKSRP
jgi:hypothetical protein